MTIHREGYPTIAIVTLFLGLGNTASYYFLSASYGVVFISILLISVLFWGFILSFFRVPSRIHTQSENSIIAPADGEVVVIEEVEPDEYFNDRRIQVSIFMSPFNVHVNRNPISGTVVYSTYHPGKYLVAWHPKSSTENERHSVVYQKNGREILVKQIAGALARRIVNYLQPGQTVQQNAEMGFIKFGSRVDLLLPLDAVIKVKIGDRPLGGVTEIATW
ncbi:MAG: phosphatidylserine decarboxylase family protein [Sphingomonadales bacterium]|nr:phosphatidylserine decarboxylase family protein [Sphingomonadales bacterium]